MVVETPAVLRLFGSSLATAFAPAVLAAFGSGPSLVTVRAMAPGGAATYQTLLNKDLRIVRSEMDKLDLPLPAAALAAELFRSAAVNGHGRDGTQAISRIYQMLAGIDYSSPSPPGRGQG